RAAAAHAEVTLLAKPHAGILLRHFAPGVGHEALVGPWTAFRGKYRFTIWPWKDLLRTRRHLRNTRFDVGVSARRDPRDHALLLVSGARRRLGFPRAGSGILLTNSLSTPSSPHRASHWTALGDALGWSISA